MFDLDAASCPIIGIASESREHDSQWHAHQRTQLLYLTEGAITLLTADRIGHLEPLQAIWLPEGVRHRAVMQGRFAYRSLYFDVQAYRDLPRAAVIIEVSQLLRELIVCVAEWPTDDALTEARTRLVRVLLDELETAPASPLYLPMPRERRIGAIANGLVEDQSEQRTLDEWADRVGPSARTLARLRIMLPHRQAHPIQLVHRGKPWRV
ncbi:MULTISPECIES: AraC family ligand binding domain-containing protein [Burkholderia]|jgi:hypothetical protein|uniref:AraC family ligand binding domain-containing protein n=1 Tax=Burkholderia TaxID=32008 RepID=UPI001FC82A06|nr:AraC family ligand binding domain-containing protein [Burkholderia ambifaria]